MFVQESPSSSDRKSPLPSSPIYPAAKSRLSIAANALICCSTESSLIAVNAPSFVLWRKTVFLVAATRVVPILESSRTNIAPNRSCGGTGHHESPSSSEYKTHPFTEAVYMRSPIVTITGCHDSPPSSEYQTPLFKVPTYTRAPMNIISLTDTIPFPKIGTWYHVSPPSVDAYKASHAPA